MTNPEGKALMISITLALNLGAFRTWHLLPWGSLSVKQLFMMSTQIQFKAFILPSFQLGLCVLTCANEDGGHGLCITIVWTIHSVTLIIPAELAVG